MYIYQYVLFLPNCLVLIWLSTLKKICPSTENQEVLLYVQATDRLWSPITLSKHIHSSVLFSSLPSECFSWSIIIFTMEYSQNPTTFSRVNITIPPRLTEALKMTMGLLIGEVVTPELGAGDHRLHLITGILLPGLDLCQVCQVLWLWLWLATVDRM